MSGFGILCSGQGSQHKAMFDILEDDRDAQGVLQSASSFFGCHPVEYLHCLPEQGLFRNLQAQLLIATLQMAIWTSLRRRLPTPKVFAGYSLGEVVTYGCAGSLTVEKMLGLIQQRAGLMDAAAPQHAGMLAVRGLTRPEIDELCEATGVEVAIINSPDHFVLGGPLSAVLRSEEHPLANRVTKSKRIPVSVPSHTSWMTAAGKSFANELEQAGLTDPLCPVLAGINGTLVRHKKDAIPALSQQIYTPIDWMACMQTSSEMGCSMMLELGPGNALKSIMQDHPGGMVVRSVEDFRSLQGVADWMHKQLC